MEKWRFVEGYDNYLVSDKGNVMTLPIISKVIDGTKKGTNQKAGKLLKQRALPSGHKQVALIKDGKPNWKYVHQLVAQTWLKRMKGNLVVMHKDNNPNNNQLENLQWGTQLENIRWIYKDDNINDLGNGDVRYKKIYNMIEDLRSKTNYSVNKCFEIIGKKYNRSYSTILQYYYKGKNL